jgi:hypothetical protein
MEESSREKAAFPAIFVGGIHFFIRDFRRFGQGKQLPLLAYISHKETVWHGAWRANHR